MKNIMIIAAALGAAGYVVLRQQEKKAAAEARLWAEAGADAEPGEA